MISHDYNTWLNKKIKKSNKINYTLIQLLRIEPQIASTRPPIRVSISFKYNHCHMNNPGRKVRQH